MTKALIGFVALAASACTGALHGGVVNGRDDRRTVGKQTWDAKCASCHEHRIAPIVASVAAPDLFSPKWKADMEEIDGSADRFRTDKLDPRVVHAAWMYMLFNNVCSYGRERTLDGKRPTYNDDDRTTLDGLPRFVTKEKTVVVMPPCGLSDEALDAVRSWITCYHYPGSQYCAQMR